MLPFFFYINFPMHVVVHYIVEDYDFEENNISEYEYEASVDNFLIDEEQEEEW